MSKRIVSLLPAATEMVAALGLLDQLVGISFECDFPETVKTLPRVVTTSIASHAMTPIQIDQAVAAKMQAGETLYQIDEQLLASLKPDIILTQNLCQVCAPSGNELQHALKHFSQAPEVIFMSPSSLADIEENLRELAHATGTEARAEDVIADGRARIAAVQQKLPGRKPTVFVMEWVDPIYCSGHWIAEMTELADGIDKLARKHEDSVRISFADLEQYDPEIIVVAPCGYNEAQAKTQLPYLEKLPGWKNLRAVKNRRVHVIDANAYLVRPGPRVVDGIELLSKIFYGETGK